MWIGIGCALAAAVWRLSPILLTAAVVWSADVLATLGKVIFGRDRPFVAYPDEAPLGPRPGSSSFPSGHATTAFAGALVLSFLVPRAWPLFYALAAAIAYSRLYLGVHYPADVAAGALLGTAVAAGLVLAHRARRRGTGA